MAEREIKIVISAQDDYTAALNKFNSAIGDMGVKGAASSSNMQTAMTNAFNGIQAAWLQVGAAIAATAWLQSAAKDALEAETNLNRLRIQLEGIGKTYNSTVMAAVNSAAAYARVQDEEVNRTLQELIFTTGDAEKSVANLNITYDLAYQKGISASEAAGLVGKAMTGNIEPLGRYMSEFKNINEVLGKYATETEKAAYAMAVLEEKTNGALSKMTEHEKKVRDTTNAYKDLKQWIGAVVLEFESMVLGEVTFERPRKSLSELSRSIGNLIDSLRYGTEAVQKMDAAIDTQIKLDEFYERAITLVGNAHKKTAGEIAKSIKAHSDLTEAKKKAAEAAKKAAEEEARAYEQVEGKITSIDSEIAKLTGDKEALLTIQAQELVSLGANTSQLERYIAALERKSKVEAQNKASKERQTFITDLGKKNPYEEKVDNEAIDVFQTYQSNMANLLSFNQQVRDEIGRLTKEGYITQAEAEVAYSNLSISEAQRRKDYQISAAGETFGALSNVMQNLYTATGSKSKEMFTAMKAFAIAEATIKGYQATIDSYEAGAKIGGPAVGAAFAAVAAVATAGMIAQIASVEPGSGATVTSSGEAVTSYEGGSTEAYPTELSSSSDSSTPTQNITINIQNGSGSAEYWQEIVENNIIPAINDASDRNIEITINRA